MSHTDIDEEVPVRNFADYASLKEDTGFTKDEEQETTLRQVYVFLKNGVDELHGFNAFDLTETELKMKQQIKAHRMAADLLEPALEMVTSALATVDEKFRERNKR